MNHNIFYQPGNRHFHSKASETYVEVRFTYPDCDSTWEGWVPIEYRRTGLFLQQEAEIKAHLEKVYEAMHPSRLAAWKAEQAHFWAERNAETTKAFYDILEEGGWKCRACTLPQNPNFARRIQDLKEMGYTLATDTKHFCPHCGKNTTHLLLLPLPRVNADSNGYETWSKSLRKRIANVLTTVDVYDITSNPHGCPDHKFSEIRWDENTLAENPDDMTDEQIRSKFQWLSNQHNLQKREACRKCYQTGKRAVCFGIPFFYQGTESWDASIPTRGKEAEAGCIGCPWYDLAEWRRQLNLRLNH